MLPLRPGNCRPRPNARRRQLKCPGTGGSCWVRSAKTRTVPVRSVLPRHGRPSRLRSAKPSTSAGWLRSAKPSTCPDGFVRPRHRWCPLGLFCQDVGRFSVASFCQDIGGHTHWIRSAKTSVGLVGFVSPRQRPVSLGSFCQDSGRPRWVRFAKTAAGLVGFVLPRHEGKSPWLRLPTTAVKCHFAHGPGSSRASARSAGT